LLLGINAHINYDLPYAVIRAGMNVNCDRCYHDHFLINDALRLTTPRVRQRIATLYRRSLHLTYWIYGRSIDKAVVETFRRARDCSWALAQALMAASGDGERARIGQLMDARAALAGQIIQRHKYSPAKCLATLHEVEDLMEGSKQSPQRRYITVRAQFGEARPTLSELHAALSTAN
jgi:hypothetical protein